MKRTVVFLLFILVSSAAATFGQSTESFFGKLWRGIDDTVLQQRQSARSIIP